MCGGGEGRERGPGGQSSHSSAMRHVMKMRVTLYAGDLQSARPGACPAICVASRRMPQSRQQQQAFDRAHSFSAAVRQRACSS